MSPRLATLSLWVDQWKLWTYCSRIYNSRSPNYQKRRISFGVVLLELLNGRRAFYTILPAGEGDLVESPCPYLTDERKISRIIDSRLEGQYTMKTAYRACS